MRTIVKGKTNERAGRYRRRLRKRAWRGVEFVVSREDGERIKQLADVLRRGGPARQLLRRNVDAALEIGRAPSGLALFPFLGDPPVEKFELELPDRNCDDDEPVDFSGLRLLPFLADTSLEEVEIELERRTMTFTDVNLSEG